MPAFTGNQFDDCPLSIICWNLLLGKLLMSFNAGQEISILKLGKYVILTKNKNKRKKCNSFFKKLVIINNFNVLAGIAQKKTCGNLIFIVVP